MHNPERLRFFVCVEVKEHVTFNWTPRRGPRGTSESTSSLQIHSFDRESSYYLPIVATSMIALSSTAVITTILLFVFAVSTTKSLPAGIYPPAIHQRNEPETLLGASYTRRRANETYWEASKTAAFRSPDSYSQTDYSASMLYSMRDIIFPSCMHPRLNASKSGSNLQRRQPRPLSDQTNLPPPSTPSPTSNVVPPNTSVTFIARPTNNAIKKYHRKMKKGGRRMKKHNLKNP